MNETTVAIPRPEVQHLPTIFRRLQAGEIRVPAFQRSFSWTEQQIVSLLDSVMRGYPVGSLLLWEARERVFKTSQPDDVPFPVLPERYPTSFVLDGLQRLSSLYGVFFYSGPPDAKDKFNVVYDLRNELFKHFDPAEASDADFPLRALFSVKDLLKEQRRLLTLGDAEVLVERTVKLQTVFQEYLLPTVTINQKDVVEVVEIFRRINSTGTPLGTVDFLRALTWSDDFDLNDGIRAISDASQRAGFAFDDETVLKVLAVVSGRSPTSDDVLRLRGEQAASMKSLVARGSDVLLRSTGFLKEHCFIHSADFLPYEGQLLAVAKLFAGDKPPSIEAELELTKWFWTVSFNEQLRGKPDHYVARQLREVALLAIGERKELSRRLTLTAADFMERRFIKGKALSAVFVCMFAARGARSLITGEPISPSDYLHSFVPERMSTIVEHADLVHLLESPLPSPRVFANLILTTESDAKVLRAVGWAKVLTQLEEQYGADVYAEILDSQFLDASSAHAFDLSNRLTDGGDAAVGAMSDRAIQLAGFAEELVQ